MEIRQDLVKKTHKTKSYECVVQCAKAIPNGPYGPWFWTPHRAFIVVVTDQYVKSGSFSRKLLYGIKGETVGT